MQDQGALAAAVGRLYEAALAPDAETQWMDLLRDTIGAEHAVLAEAGPGGSRAWHSAIDDGMRPLVRQLSDTTIYDPSLTRMPVGAACRMTDYFPLRDLMRHDLFHQIVRPLHGGFALTCVCSSGSIRKAIAVCRDARLGIDYADDEVADIQPLLDHLCNAMRLRERIGTLAAEASSAMSALEAVREGVVMIDARGRLRHANAEARRILVAGDGLQLERGQLRAVRSVDDRALQALVHRTRVLADALDLDRGNAAPALLHGTGHPVTVGRRETHWPLFVAAVPARKGASVFEGALPDGVVLLVRDPERSAGIPVEDLTALFGLTRREASLAKALCDGSSLLLAATQLGITEGTARQYLKGVFAKTGTHRQAELVWLLAGVGG